MTQFEQQLPEIQVSNPLPSRLLDDTRVHPRNPSEPASAQTPPFPEVKLDRNQSKLSAAPPVVDKSLEQVSREINACQLDREVARALDAGNIDVAGKLFDDAFKAWGPSGVRQLTQEAAKLEKSGTGLDLKFELEDPTYIFGKTMIPKFSVVQSRGLVGSILAWGLGWSENTLANTGLHQVIDRANSEWKQQSELIQKTEFERDVNELEKMIKDGRKTNATSRLIDILENTGAHDNYYTVSTKNNYYTDRERRIGSYMGHPRMNDMYGYDVQEELTRRLTALELSGVFPERIYGSCNAEVNPTCSKWKAPGLEPQKATIDDFMPDPFIPAILPKVIKKDN